MALTLKDEQSLKDVGLIAFFDKAKPTYQELAQQSFDFVKQNFPKSAVIRHDDVAEALLPLVDVNEKFKNHLSASKLTQKYWYRRFVDLILDRCWVDIIKVNASKTAKKKGAN